MSKSVFPFNENPPESDKTMLQKARLLRHFFFEQVYASGQCIVLVNGEKFFEKTSSGKRRKREYLNDVETRDFAAKLNGCFEANVEILWIMVGARQTVER